jgi:glycosyltransferase involved in cell wall biosynthesis
MSDRPTLGVVAICRNEERDLPGFIDHLIGWVDQIVIVDDGSTDRTCAIAESAGDKIRLIRSARAEGEYYAHQRNKGIDASSSDWLIHMDIDERVSPELAVEILTAIADPTIDAYRYRRRNYFLHRPMQGGDWTGWNLAHLARRGTLRFSGMYHEKIDLVPQSRVGQLSHFMFHFNDESYEERLRKSAVYQVEIAEDIMQSKQALGYFQILFSFIKEFAYQYFWKKGFLDGTIGLVWAFHAASANNRAYIIAWDAQHRIPREKLEDEIRAMWERGLDDVLQRRDVV